MAVTALRLYQSARDALFGGGLGVLASGPKTACLLVQSYSPDPVTHSQFSDVIDAQVQDPDYRPLAVPDLRIVSTPDAVQLHSGPLDFGHAVSFHDVKYLLLVAGQFDDLRGDNLLIAVADLSSPRGTLSSYGGAFSITPPEAGWFSLSEGNVS